MQDRIEKMKTIVYKTLVDLSTVKLIGEREKVRLYTKMGIVKPKKDDIKLESLTTIYEPFYTIKGRYYIDYYRKRIYQLDIEEDVIELFVLEKTLKPKTSKLAKLRGKERQVGLKAEQRIIKEKSSYIILNQKAEEIDLEKFPVAPSEEDNEKILVEKQKKKLELSPKKIVEILKSKVIDRPGDVERENEEFFEVSEHTLVYLPIIISTYKHIKTQVRKIISVNGVTAKILPYVEHISKSKDCLKCGKQNNKDAKFCRDCGQSF